MPTSSNSTLHSTCVLVNIFAPLWSVIDDVCQCDLLLLYLHCIFCRRTDGRVGRIEPLVVRYVAILNNIYCVFSLVCVSAHRRFDWCCMLTNKFQFSSNSRTYFIWYVLCVRPKWCPRIVYSQLRPPSNKLENLPAPRQYVRQLERVYVTSIVSECTRLYIIPGAFIMHSR